MTIRVTVTARPLFAATRAMVATVARSSQAPITVTLPARWPRPPIATTN